MATNFEKFQKLLEELFQLDQADLDFGIYRIMNQKRDEVVRFLEKDLLPQVKEAFSQYKSADKDELQKELDKLVKPITDAGMNPDDSPKVQELRQQMADSSVDITALENEVFSHLFSFFRRYYHEGDFLSLRRYKEGVYAIPYEGEEVKLHWANHDQYYVKSSEYFRDYIFTMPSGKRVRVHLVAASTEQDNKKEAPGNERRFVLCNEDPIYEENGELFIRFEYRPDDGKKKQDALNKEAIERVLGVEGFEEWVRELSKPAPTKANPNRTVLERHLTQYTARNTFDYFIHKDLGGFLRRELDFYIKNEVMHLDDIEHDTVPRVEQYLSKIKVIRRIAHKIIQFLEQLENFQKKLWLKKKFVVETNYCITLDRVSEELYPEIAANDAQREEWIRLFAIDEIGKDLNGPGLSIPLTIEFLSANQYLVLDTAFFSRDFVDRLLSYQDNFDAQIDGILIHGENFNVLDHLATRHARAIDCVYIDPPYNTGGDGFCYKDSYQHSSWMSMLRERLAQLSRVTNDSATFFSSIDDNEACRLRMILDELFGEDCFEAQIIIQSNRRGQTYKSIAKTHEYLLAYGLGVNSKLLELPRDNDGDDADERGSFELWELRNRNPKFGRFNRPKLFFPIYVDPNSVGGDGLAEVSLSQSSKFTVGVLPRNSRGEDSCWRWGQDKVAACLAEGNREVLVGKQKVSEKWGIYQKARKDGKKAKTIWTDTSVINERGTVEVGSLGFTDFGFPKPLGLIKQVVTIGCDSEGCVLDCFAGSGTTGHAVIDLNRGDGGQRKYILVEMGSYFDTVMKPRIEKAIYSQDWDAGNPVDRHGVSHCLKYIHLESYEDALNNLELKRTDQQVTLINEDKGLREQYLLSYMLDVESRGSQSLLNVDSFRNPDQYKLKVERNGETQLVNVDLVETFNWLLGLTVKHIDVIRGVRVAEGTNPEGERVLVLWRTLDDTDNDTLDEWFRKQDYNTKDQEYDLIYVNGDNNLENLRRTDQTWKVRLIEEEFQRLMFLEER